jgi:hypothetical protein
MVTAEMLKEAFEAKVANSEVTFVNPLDANPFNVHPGGCYFVNGRYVDANGNPIEFAAPEVPTDPVNPPTDPNKTVDTGKK